VVSPEIAVHLPRGEIAPFGPSGTIERSYFEKPYYLGPDAGMRHTGTCGPLQAGQMGHMTTGTYTLKEVQSLVGMPQPTIRRLITTGFISPGRGPRREYRLSFQDVVMLRTAQSLRGANIPSRKVLRALKRLMHTWDVDQPLSAVRLTVIGNDVAVRHRDKQWHAESGQLLIDFEHRPGDSGPSLLHRTARESDAQKSSADWFQYATELERENPAEAEVAYRRAISADPSSVDAYLNLACVLCDAGQFEAAITLLRDGLKHRPEDALLHFNLAVALEDDGQYWDALAAYDACIARAAHFADAHFNAARLHQQLGNVRGAIRHFNQFRKLERERDH
jgi:Tetratricopeptide repeat/MerR HTH family regulatory protein